MTSQVIPDEAVEAAARAIFERYSSDWDILPERTKRLYLRDARVKLEAALPYLLSHEREETRLAHLDAVVNAATVDRLEGELARAKAEGWDEGMWAMYNTTSSEWPPVPEANPYRMQEAGE